MNSGFRFTLDQASKQAWEVDALYYFLWLVTAFFSVLIFVLIAYLSLRYRRVREDERPHPTIESKWLELTYTFIPFGIVMVIFFWGTRTYFNVYGRTYDNALNIHVVGKQWMWKLQHPDGKREINELHLPVNHPVTVTIAAQDVIHSFFIPAFRAKMDAVPGRYTKMSFTPSKIGEYHLFCAEYCGALHSQMIGRVIVMEEQQYQDWLKGTPSDDAPALAGQKLFISRGCITCHGQFAPTLAGLYGQEAHQVLVPATGKTITVKVDDAYLRESILDSTAKLAKEPGKDFGPLMPSYRGQITEEELLDLIAYIKSLQDVKDAKSGTVRNAQDQRDPTPLAPKQ